MAFTPGTWTKLPPNCTRSYSLTCQRCAAYGTVSFKACLDWVTNATKTCINWATQTVQTCVQWGGREPPNRRNRRAQIPAGVAT
jgi:hypothetical protein